MLLCLYQGVAGFQQPKGMGFRRSKGFCVIYRAHTKPISKQLALFTEIHMSTKGVVKFQNDSGFGFIWPIDQMSQHTDDENKRPNLFFHVSDVDFPANWPMDQKTNRRKLHKGDIVTFEVTQREHEGTEREICINVVPTGEKWKLPKAPRNNVTVPVNYISIDVKKSDLKPLQELLNDILSPPNAVNVSAADLESYKRFSNSLAYAIQKSNRMAKADEAESGAEDEKQTKSGKKKKADSQASAS